MLMLPPCHSNRIDLPRRRAARARGFMLIEASRHLALLMALAFLVLLALAGGAGYWLAGRGGVGAGVAPPTAPKAFSDQIAPTYAAKPGPWGEIRCQRSVIEVPEEYLGLRSWETEPVRWVFRDYSAAALKEFLARLEGTAAETRELGDTSRWSVTPEGVTVQPRIETVLALTPRTRARLYAELARFEENVTQQQPFHWPVKTDLFAGAPVAAESRAIFQKLSYSRGAFLLFSDWQALLSALPDDAQRVAVGQALMGRFVLFASVHVTPQTDVEGLIRYWGKGGYAKDIRPILEAAARLPQGMEVSLANLLPPQFRSRLNTFPFTAPDRQLNCHWTTFNFFAEQPEPPAGGRFWREKLRNDFSPVTDAPRYGDVLLLLKPDRSLIHSCVYLADDIVYTKNGGSPFAPWQLSTLPDLLEFYSWDLPEHTALQTNWFRRRT